MKKPVLVVPSTTNEYFKLNKTYTDILDKYNLKYLISSYNLNILDTIDMFGGIILTGGGDFSMKYLNENLHPLATDIYPCRDNFEIQLVKKAYKNKIPTLGICRGAQCINLALGGSITQHIENHVQTQEKINTSHFININKSSKLYKILGLEKIEVNSFHHQVINSVSDKLVCSAKSEDGFIEAVETPDNLFFIGLQWHPECLSTYESNKLFEEFSNAVVF